jgi:hypothetical protein
VIAAYLIPDHPATVDGIDRFARPQYLFVAVNVSGLPAKTKMLVIRWQSQAIGRYWYAEAPWKHGDLSVVAIPTDANLPPTSNADHMISVRAYGRPGYMVSPRPVHLLPRMTWAELSAR